MYIISQSYALYHIDIIKFSVPLSTKIIVQGSQHCLLFHVTGGARNIDKFLLLAVSFNSCTKQRKILSSE